MAYELAPLWWVARAHLAVGAAAYALNVSWSSAFPIRYYEPGTSRVARPNAGPTVRVPMVATPPLRTGR